VYVTLHCVTLQLVCTLVILNEWNLKVNTEKVIAGFDACVACDCYLAFLFIANKQSVREFLHQDMLVLWHHSDRARTQQQPATTATAASAATITTTRSSDSSRSTDSSAKCSNPAATDTAAVEQASTILSQEVL
jgi:hypothetical protein